MSLFLQAIDKIQWLSKKADVTGEPRITLTFDNDADTARFLVELNRDINNIVAVKHHEIARFTEFSVYGIRVRII